MKLIKSQVSLVRALNLLKLKQKTHTCTAIGPIDLSRVYLIRMSHLIPESKWDFDECPSVINVLKMWDLPRLKCLDIGALSAIPTGFFPKRKPIAFLGHTYKISDSLKGNDYLYVEVFFKSFWRREAQMVSSHTGPIKRNEPLVPVMLS